MAKVQISSPASRVHSEDVMVIEPLTRGGYKRLPSTEHQIVAGIVLSSTALVKWAQQEKKGTSEFLSEEAVAYFIRRADRARDIKVRDELFHELFKRCMPYFRGWFGGFDEQDRDDLQAEVTKRIVEDLLAEDDRGDFMQVRFWRYLKYKKIDACRKAVRYNEHNESLDSGYFGNGISEGRIRLETEVDRVLSPEKFAMISQGLEKLPPHLRRAFVLRHRFGFRIGTDNPAGDGEKGFTIAAQFHVSGRTIRNWLKEADSLLDSFRGAA